MYQMDSLSVKAAEYQHARQQSIPDTAKNNLFASRAQFCTISGGQIFLRIHKPGSPRPVRVKQRHSSAVNNAELMIHGYCEICRTCKYDRMCIVGYSAGTETSTSN